MAGGAINANILLSVETIAVAVMENVLGSTLANAILDTRDPTARIKIIVLKIALPHSKELAYPLGNANAKSSIKLLLIVPLINDQEIKPLRPLKQPLTRLSYKQE